MWLFDLLLSLYSTGMLVYVPFAPEMYRLGGSALAQCYGQIGDNAPDMDDVQLFSKAFNTTQKLIAGKLNTYSRVRYIPTPLFLALDALILISNFPL